LYCESRPDRLVVAYEARAREDVSTRFCHPLLPRARDGSDPVATAVANRLLRSARALAALPIAFSLAANGAGSQPKAIKNVYPDTGSPA
jgi:hypothetical protein